jgi:hypothetical protein
MRSRRTILIILSTLVLVTLLGCNGGKIYKKEYFPGTKNIKSEGYYLNGHPIGVMTYYSKAGLQEQTVEFDSSGLLNGQSIFYYGNGIPSEISNYDKGSETGKWVTFRMDGTKQVVGFSLEGKTVGDKYFFDSLGHLIAYNFFDLNNQVRAAYKYDTLGNVIENGFQDCLIVDSVQILEGKNKVDTFYTTLVISHKPKTAIKKIRIENIGHHGQVLHSADIDPQYPFNFYSNLIGEDVDSVKLIAERYDSVMAKSKYLIIVQPTK